MFLALNWSVSPTLLEIGSLEIRYYGLLFATAFFVGHNIAQKSFRRQGLEDKYLEKLFMYVGIATILGARLGHVFFYDWGYYSEHPLEILMIWKGGLASHGAAAAIIFATYLFAKKVGKSFYWALDEMIVPVAFAGFCIRLGNFFNSEIIGEPSQLPWAVVFERVDMVPRHPAQLYEALCYLAIFIILKKSAYFAAVSGRKFGFFIMAGFIARFTIEFVKENQVAFEDGMVLNMGQILSIPLILAGSWMLYKLNKHVAK